MAAARKEADDKTALATQKLASVDQLEKENTRMQTTLNEANRLTANWKKQIQLNLDLELARTELQKVRDGAAGKTILSTG